LAPALAVGILGPATFALLLQALSALPQLVVDERANRYLAVGALGTAMFGALAALAPAKLRRTVAYVLVADMGLALAGMATFTRLGMAGAALHLAFRSVVALVLLGAAAQLERDDRASLDGEVSAPYLWGTLVAGSLALAGLPPLGGFAANWPIYQAVALSEWRIAALLAAASGVCTVALLVALGRLRREYPRPWRRPRPVEWLLMVLAAVACLWGFAPGPALGAVHAAVSQLTFLQPF
jgi:formate hydrogenlyase subunit 3/multisubunit Na+/H+ antiporter MnhD subunit